MDQAKAARIRLRLWRPADGQRPPKQVVAEVVDALTARLTETAETVVNECFREHLERRSLPSSRARRQTAEGQRQILGDTIDGYGDAESAITGVPR